MEYDSTKKFLIKDYGYVITTVKRDKDVEIEQSVIITNSRVKEEYVKAFPWVKAKGKRWENKKYFRDPNPAGIYWNYKNAKEAIRMLTHLSKMSRRVSGKGYNEEFNKYKIKRVNGIKIALNIPQNKCCTCESPNGDFEGDYLSTVTLK